MPSSIIGNSVRRTEDKELLTGEAKYVADLEVPDAAVIHFVRSDMAHARVSVDVSGAAGAPGVLAVYRGQDIPVAPQQGWPGPEQLARPILASETVKFVGDPVAAIVAESSRHAVDAAALVEVDYDPLDPVIGIEAAIPGDLQVHPGMANGNVVATYDLEAGESGLDEAAVVVSARIDIQRLAPAPLEPNGFVASWEGEHLTAWAATQGPFFMRVGLAAALEVPVENLRVIVPFVGGGFGAKFGAYVEMIATAWAARELGRPVRWTEQRSESMVAMTHGRAQLQFAEMGFSGEGKILGLRATVVGDAGAYPSFGANMPYMTLLLSQGVYDIPGIDFSGIAVCTHTTPTSAYRGAGRPEAVTMLERLMDIGAAELGMDPVDLRRKNLLPADRFPMTSLAGANYDSANYEEALAHALELSGYAELRAEQRARRDRGDRFQLGIGVAVYTEVTAFGWISEFGEVEINPDGSATVRAGTSVHGQGHQTAYAQIVSETLGIEVDRIRLAASDTDAVPSGFGTAGSRSMQVGGSAVHNASVGVLAKAKELAAHLLEAPVDDMVVSGDGLSVRGVPATAVSWSELALAAAVDARRPEGMAPGLRDGGVFDQGESTYPFGAHVAVVELDTETGGMGLVRLVAVDDCGTIINPMLVEGQVHGGLAQGIAQGLFEEVQFDSNGVPQTTNLMTYLVPAASELPALETGHTVTPSPHNPLGVKGIGESGTIGGAAAIQNAGVDALAHLGVRHLDTPFTPNRVWEALQDPGAYSSARMFDRLPPAVERLRSFQVDAAVF